MKNYKLIQNRPELTNGQIKEGMDFNKVKNNAVLAKSTFIKSLFIKGLLGIIAVSAVVVLYKNYPARVTEKPQGISTNSTNATQLSQQDTVARYSKAVPDKNPIALSERKVMASSSTIILPKTDTTRVTPSTTNNPETNEGIPTYTDPASGDHIYPDIKETKSSSNFASFITTLGKDDIKEIDKSLVKINERLYASKYEVSNKLYRAFLNSLKITDNNKLLQIAEIDTLRWRDKSYYNEPYVQYYHTHQAYSNYPVVNITYEAANLYCEWLTTQYNSNPKREFKQIRFRLPSEKEWKAAAQAGDSTAVYPWKGQEIRNKKGQIMANFKVENGGELFVNGKHEQYGDITTAVESYWANNYGLYNMSGNVAEMINERGIAKGGSWKDIAENLKINTRYKYDGHAQPFIGFRYFAEIIEK